MACWVTDVAPGVKNVVSAVFSDVCNVARRQSNGAWRRVRPGVVIFASSIQIADAAMHN